VDGRIKSGHDGMEIKPPARCAYALSRVMYRNVAAKSRRAEAR
jgi:hypothetical protein